MKPWTDIVVIHMPGKDIIRFYIVIEQDVTANTADRDELFFVSAV